MYRYTKFKIFIRQLTARDFGKDSILKAWKPKQIFFSALNLERIFQSSSHGKPENGGVFCLRMGWIEMRLDRIISSGKSGFLSTSFIQQKLKQGLIRSITPKLPISHGFLHIQLKVQPEKPLTPRSNRKQPV